MQSSVVETVSIGGRDGTLRVWDPLVRVFHWTLAASFFVAYFSGDEALALHVWAGYLIGGLIILRVVWGFVGPKHARFTDFIFAPLSVVRYLVDLARFRAGRYIGHSPAGGAMVLALLLGLALTTATGLQLYAVDENAGPLAGITTVAAPAGIAAGDEAEEAEEAEGGGGSFLTDEHLLEEVHEFLANLTLALVLLHVGGVMLASFVHKENLAKAMITGRKAAESH